jgi:hypothetical protein
MVLELMAMMGVEAEGVTRMTMMATHDCVKIREESAITKFKKFLRYE